MSLKKLIPLIILSFFFLSSHVFAEYKAVITGNAVGMKGGTYNFSLYKGDLVTVLQENTTEYNRCSAGTMKVNYQGYTGYVCSTYVKKFDTSGSCKTELNNLGFPDSYVESICALKSIHPNWQFRPILTNLDFKDVVQGESSCGKNLINISINEYIDTTCTVTDGPYKAASQKAIAYYMDPRNFFSERDVFQFESLKYEVGLENTYAEIIKKTISSMDAYNYHIGKGNDLTNFIISSGKTTDIIPSFIASRMKNELGNTDTERDLYSGVYTGHNNQYYGYYNFFNIGVSGDCVKANGRAYCGLSHAKSKGWDNPNKAIDGGASLLANSYIGRGQYTSYLQKFNVVPNDSSNRYLHQYMTNIIAPTSEAELTYSSYSNILDRDFVFYIPVYNNIDATIQNINNGAVDVNGGSASDIAINTIVTASGYKTNNNQYIAGVGPETSVDDLKGKIEAVSGANTVTISGNQGNLIGTGTTVKISNSQGTKEYKIVIKGDTSGDGKVNALDLLQVQKSILKTYNLEGASSLAGDTSGDGKVNALDLLQVQKHILHTYTIVQ